MDASTRYPRPVPARIKTLTQRQRSLSNKLREIRKRSPQDEHAFHVLADLVLARLNASANVASSR
jgi:hypothetical protein